MSVLKTIFSLICSLAALSQVAAQGAEPARGIAQSDPVSATVQAARDAARADRNQEAAALFAQAIRLAPQHRDALALEYADQLTYSGQPAEAIPLYEEALAKTAQPPEDQRRARKGLGLALLWTDQPTRARPIYEALARQQPDDADVQRSLARALSWSGRQREAIGHLQSYLARHPDDQEAQVQLAQAQVWMGRNDLAAQTLAGVPSSREDAANVRAELGRGLAPRTTVDTQISHQSDKLDIKGLRLGQLFPFAQGRGMVGARLEQIEYTQADGVRQARATRPMALGRYRFSNAVELNAEAGRERIESRDGVTRQPAVYAAWLTLWPDDVFRVDVSANRNTLDNLLSLRQGLTMQRQEISAELRPTERERYTVRLEHANYSDGNHRDGGKLEAEYRLRTHPEIWVGLQHTRFAFDRQTQNGYFNPLRFESTQMTVRGTWRPDGAQGRWELSAVAALGHEHAVPDGGKPAYDVLLRAAWRIDGRTRLAAHAQRFSSRNQGLSGFGRTTAGLRLERDW